jgi:adenosylmethionine-8-amino-7-oxononanoate aminotransferase
MQTAPLPVPIVAGRGALLIDEQGREYIDGVSSWWVNIHGHAHPYIAGKIAEQAATLEHCIFAGLTHPPAVDLSERLLSVLPYNEGHPDQRQTKVFFSDNGSTAVEVALKMAIQYWHNQGIAKNKILALRHGYHGDTFGAMSVSARSVFTRVFEDYLFDVEYIPIPVADEVGAGIFISPGECRGSMPEDSYYEEVRRKLESGDYAAFIFEPLVLGAGGMRMYAPAALEKLVRLCREQGLLIITDEVMTGFGRTGNRFAMDYLESKADIICLSKGLTGGTMALGITTCVEKVYDAFLSTDKLKMFLHGHSFTANPVACAAALASLDLFLEDSCRQNRERVTARQAAFLERIAEHPAIKNPRQTGTIAAFELVTAPEDSYMNEIRDFVSDYFVAHQVILRPLGNTIYVLPPYCITDGQLDRMHGVIASLLDEVQRRR